MNQLKPWQAGLIAFVAVLIAVGVIWRTSARSSAGAPVPAAMPRTPRAMPGAMGGGGGMPAPGGLLPGTRQEK